MVKSLNRWIVLAAFWIGIGSLPGHAQDTLAVEVIRKAYFDSYQLESKERFLEAISALAPVQKVYGNTYTVNYRTGWLFYRNQSWAEALKFYHKALAISPSSMEANTGIIQVLMAKQDWKAVEEQCKRALQLDYGHSSVNLWMILAEEALENRTAARKTVYRMLALYPTSVVFLVELGKIQYADGEFVASHSTFTSVQILDPYNQSATYYLNLLKSPKP